MQKVFCEYCKYYNKKGYCENLKMPVYKNNYCAWYKEIKFNTNKRRIGGEVMKIWNVIYFDSGEYETRTLATFRNEDDANKALKYAINCKDYKELDYIDFEIKNSTIYDNFKEFVSEQDCY